MPNILRFRTKGQLAALDRHAVSLPDDNALAIESLRQNCELAAASLRKIAAHLAKCRQVMGAMEESPEKEQSMQLVAKALVDVGKRLAFAGTSGRPEGSIVAASSDE